MTITATPKMEPTQLRLRWRSELIATPRQSRGKAGYLIEDPVTGQFHRLGEREYRVACSLNGQQPVVEVLPKFSTLLSTAELLALVRWLTDNGLVEVFDPQGNLVSQPRARRSVSWDPFFVRCSILRSPPIFDQLLPATRWLFSQHVVVLLTLASLWLGVQLSLRWDELAASSAGIFLPQQQVRFFLVWLVLKVVHELAHGIVCRKYSGEVREVGVSFIFGMPTPYCDVTSAWRFPERWQRIATSLAGMYAEWIVAALAGGLWLLVDEPATRQTCVQVLLLVGLGTLAFNANPLMRFDGYYVLIDLLDHPNLAAESQNYWRDVWQRWGWGRAATRTYSWGWPSFTLAVYGLASWLWRMTTLVTLAFAAVAMYEGVGVALVITAACLWFGRSFYLQIGALHALLTTSPGSVLRPAFLAGSGCAIIAFAVNVLPWPIAPQAVGIVRFEQEVVLRADSAGIVRELCVRDGENVVAGQLLALLHNDELELQRRQLVAACAMVEFKARQLQQEKKLVEWRAEVERQQSFRQQLADVEQKVAALEIRAPINGRLFARRWQEWLDRYVAAGDALAVIGHPDSKEIKVAVPHDALPLYGDALPRGVTVLTSGGQRWPAELVAVESQAHREPLDLTLTATAGGTLGVREVKNETNQAAAWELLEPHFTATVKLDPRVGIHLSAGQRCRVRLEDCSPTIFAHLSSQWQKWQQQFQTRTY